MLHWALVILVVATIAGFLGFGGIAFATGGIAKILFFIFVVMLFTGLIGRRSPPIWNFRFLAQGSARRAGSNPVFPLF